MANCTLSDNLEAGNSADIFYDANDHDDKSAANVIHDFQTDVENAASELRLIAGLDLEGDTLGQEDLEVLRAIQKRITAPAAVEG